MQATTTAGGTEAGLRALVERLRGAKRVAVFTHQRPDPDALGSQAAAAHILKHLGAEEIYLMQFMEAPAAYRFLQEGAPGEVAMWGSEWAGSSGGAMDVILIVDTCTYSQLEPCAGFLKAERGKVAAVDHHLTRDEVGPLIVADTQAAACVEILWELSKAAGMAMTAGLAQALMAGLVADTGWFRFDSVTPRTHEMAAALTPFVDNARLYERLSQTETRPKLALMQRALASCQWSFEDRLAVMALRQADFAQAGAAQSQTEGLVDLPMAVAAVEVSALLTEMPDGRVRASLRSKRGVDVNAVCNQFDGGGHAKAAGCRLEGPVEAAAARITEAVGRALAGRRAG
jgi:phosphoesterase RecJ-like protein